MEYQLRPAIIRDLDTVLKWVRTPDELRTWGGPGFPYPPDRRTTWDLIQGRSTPTFTMVDRLNQVVGFGQLEYQEPNSVRLFGIIISPDCRGHGLGRLLCHRLMEQAAKDFPAHSITLKVYSKNKPAITLYRSLGFAEYPSKAGGGAILMKKELAGEHIVDRAKRP